MHDARRVFVIGNSGSGKTTLARKIAEAGGRRHIDLDDYAFVDQKGTRRGLTESTELIESEIKAAPAVVEGCYADLVGALADRTDGPITAGSGVEHPLEDAGTRTPGSANALGRCGVVPLGEGCVDRFDEPSIASADSRAPLKRI